MSSLLDTVLRAPLSASLCSDVSQWWSTYRTTLEARSSPFEQACVGGIAADRLAWAFASGYQAALRSLVPDLAQDAPASFCVTEQGGNRPGHILTTVRRQPDGTLHLKGHKTWATLGPQGSTLLVAARWTDASGAPDPARIPIVVIVLEARLAGIQVIERPAARMVPELPHAEIALEDVVAPAHALLPGDGYETMVKPMRTLEDIHVSAACLAYLMREARQRAWPAGWLERCAAALLALQSMATLDRLAPTTHIALAGALESVGQLRDEATALFGDAHDETAGRWRRDSGLIGMGASASALRTQRAWERLAHP